MFYKYQRFILISLLVAAFLAIGAAFLWQVQPCRPLDIALKVSGCVRIVEFTGISLEGTALSPDNTSLAVTGMVQGSPRRDEVRTVHLPDVTPIWTTPAPDATRSLRFTPDGQKLVGASYVQNVQIWNSKTGNAIATIPKDAAYLSFSPDSKQILIDLERYSLEDYSLLGKATRPAVTGLGVTLPGWGVYKTFSPQGDLEAKIIRYNALGQEYAESATIEVYRVADQQLLRTLPETLSGDAARLSFSPDGSFLMTYNTDFRAWPSTKSSIYIWRVNDGQLLRQIDTFEDIENTAWSENSRWLLTVSNYGYHSQVAMYDIAYLSDSKK